MTETRTCFKCHAALPDNAPDGLCPACLLEAGLAAPSAAASAANSSLRAGRFTPPMPADLAGLFPHLEVLELVGSGGMGAVYKARQPNLDRVVALKILPPEIGGDPSFAERFTREARALARLNHPHIVTVHDFGKVDGLYYLLMEFVEGATLRNVIAKGSLAPREALAIVPQLCDALECAHELGIVHRDIKPENILLDRKGRAKIADFGLARLLGQAAPVGSPPRATASPGEPPPTIHRLTATGQIMGTPHYMAPEQFERLTGVEVDHRADIYSLGVVFYEMLTGELPLGRFATPSQKVQVDVRLDEVVLRSLEKEPDRRYQRASEIKGALERISSTPSATAIGTAPAASAAMGAGSPDVARVRDASTGRGPMAPHVGPEQATGPNSSATLLALRGPAAALQLTAGLTVLFWAAVYVIYAPGGELWNTFSPLSFAGFAALVLGVGSMLVAAAARLRRCLAYELVLCGSVLALLPWSPAVLVGFPAAVWTLITLHRPDVKAAYAHRSQGFGAVPRAPAQLSSRPAFVYVLAIADVIAGALGLVAFIQVGPGHISTADSWTWHIWSNIEFLLGLLAGGAVLCAGVSLLLHRPWARVFVLVTCCFLLGCLLANLPFWMLVAAPRAIDNLRLALIDQGLPLADAEARAGLTVVAGFVTLVVAIAAWIIAHLVYFTRASVMAEFARPGGSSNGARSSAHGWARWPAAAALGLPLLILASVMIAGWFRSLRDGRAVGQGSPFGATSSAVSMANGGYAGEGRDELKPGAASSKVALANASDSAWRLRAKEVVLREFHKQMLALERRFTRRQVIDEGRHVRATVFPFQPDRDALLQRYRRQCEHLGLPDDPGLKRQFPFGAARTTVIDIRRDGGRYTVEVAEEGQAVSRESLSRLPEELLRFWNPPATGSDAGVTLLGGHSEEVRALLATPDGKHLVSAGTDARVIIRPVERLAEARVVDPVGIRYLCLAPSPQGNYLFAGGEGNWPPSASPIVRIRIDDGSVERLAFPGAGAITQLFVLGGGERLLYGDGPARTVYLADPSTGSVLGTWPVFLEDVPQPQGNKVVVTSQAWALSPDGQFVAVATGVSHPDLVEPKYRLSLFDVQGNRRLISSQDAVESGLRAVPWFPDSNQLDLLLPTGEARIWSQAAEHGVWLRQADKKWHLPAGSRFMGPFPDREGHLWYVIDHLVLAFQAQGGALTYCVMVNSGATPAGKSIETITSFALLPGSRKIAAGLSDGRVVIVDAAALAE